MLLDAPPPPKTIGDCLEYAITYFRRSKLVFGHGSTNARDEAAYLILHTLGLPPDTLDLARKLTPKEIAAVMKILKRRASEKIPAAYLTKEAWLGKFRFFVDERVIIPRSFIAELLNRKLSPWITHPAAVRDVLELCTGSGCLAILAGLAFPNARIDACDISKQALAVARVNIKKYLLQSRISLKKSDLFSKIPKKRYDLIIANPPYVDARAMRALPTEYRYEPKIALAGGKTGLDMALRIIADAARFLRKRGLLILEIGHHRSLLESLYPQGEFVWLATSGGDRYVFLIERDALIRIGADPKLGKRLGPVHTKT